MKEKSEARNVSFDPGTLPIDEQLLTPGNIKFKLRLSTYAAFRKDHPDVQPSLKWLLDAGNYNASYFCKFKPPTYCLDIARHPVEQAL